MTDAKNFETSLKALENIVAQLEKPDLPLEQALQQFEEGVALSAACQKILNDAEQKIEKVQNALAKQTPTSDEDEA